MDITDEEFDKLKGRPWSEWDLPSEIDDDDVEEQRRITFRLNQSSYETDSNTTEEEGARLANSSINDQSNNTSSTTPLINSDKVEESQKNESNVQEEDKDKVSKAKKKKLKKRKKRKILTEEEDEEENNRLPAELMCLFGSYPENEIFSITTCPICNRIFKTQWYLLHYELNHGRILTPEPEDDENEEENELLDEENSEKESSNIQENFAEEDSNSNLSISLQPIIVGNLSPLTSVENDNLQESNKQENIILEGKQGNIPVLSIPNFVFNPLSIKSNNNGNNNGSQQFATKLQKVPAIRTKGAAKMIIETKPKQEEYEVELQIPEVSIKEEPNSPQNNNLLDMPKLLLQTDGAELLPTLSLQDNLKNIKQEPNIENKPVPAKKNAKKKKEPTSEGKKIIPLKDRMFDPNKHCGVRVNDGPPCKRSLTCKTHSISFRRAVPGRKDSFDALLASHKRLKSGEGAKSIDSQASIEETKETPDKLPIDYQKQQPTTISQLLARYPSNVKQEINDQQIQFHAHSTEVINTQPVIQSKPLFQNNTSTNNININQINNQPQAAVQPIIQQTQLSNNGSINQVKLQTTITPMMKDPNPNLQYLLQKQLMQGGGGQQKNIKPLSPSTTKANSPSSSIISSNSNLSQLLQSTPCYNPNINTNNNISIGGGVGNKIPNLSLNKGPQSTYISRGIIKPQSQQGTSNSPGLIQANDFSLSNSLFEQSPVLVEPSINKTLDPNVFSLVQPIRPISNISKDNINNTFTSTTNENFSNNLQIPQRKATTLIHHKPNNNSLNLFNSLGPSSSNSSLSNTTSLPRQTIPFKPIYPLVTLHNFNKSQENHLNNNSVHHTSNSSNVHSNTAAGGGSLSRINSNSEQLANNLTNSSASSLAAVRRNDCSKILKNQLEMVELSENYYYQHVELNKKYNLNGVGFGGGSSRYSPNRNLSFDIEDIESVELEESGDDEEDANKELQYLENEKIDFEVKNSGKEYYSIERTPRNTREMVSQDKQLENYRTIHPYNNPLIIERPDYCSNNINSTSNNIFNPVNLFVPKKEELNHHNLNNNYSTNNNVIDNNIIVEESNKNIGNEPINLIKKKRFKNLDGNYLVNELYRISNGVVDKNGENGFHSSSPSSFSHSPVNVNLNGNINTNNNNNGIFIENNRYSKLINNNKKRLIINQNGNINKKIMTTFNMNMNNNVTIPSDNGFFPPSSTTTTAVKDNNIIINNSIGIAQSKVSLENISNSELNNFLQQHLLVNKNHVNIKPTNIKIIKNQDKVVNMNNSTLLLNQNLNGESQQQHSLESIYQLNLNSSTSTAANNTAFNINSNKESIEGPILNDQDLRNLLDVQFSDEY